ncbi:MAG TPA: diguanylate cyclase [Bacillota bacterium]|nr:diguanylate cyclase [Bacillota bacterium]
MPKVDLIPIAAALVVLISMSSTVLYFWEGQRQLTRREYESDLATRAAIVHSRVEVHLEDARESLIALGVLLAGDPEPAGQRDFTQLARLLVTLTPKFDAVSYADPGGEVVATFGPAAFSPGSSLTDIAAYRRAVVTRTPMWSRAQWLPASQQFGVQLFVPAVGEMTIAAPEPAVLVGEIALGSLLAAAVLDLADGQAMTVSVDGAQVLAQGEFDPDAVHVQLATDIHGMDWLTTMGVAPGAPAAGFDGDAWLLLAGSGMAGVVSILVYLALSESLRARKGEERFRLLAENAQDIVYRVRLRPERQFEYLSPAVTAITGFRPDEFYADSRLAVQIASPEFRPVIESVYDGSYDYRRPLVTERRHKDGRRIWLEQRMTPIYSSAGELVAIQGIIRDITGQKLLEEQLTYLSLHDSLTGLYNRAYLEEEFDRLEDGRSYPVSLLSVDVDGLKFVNDTRGHPAGDELLRAVARALRATFRHGDVLARVGGDEFVAVLPRTDASTARQMISRLGQRLAEANRDRGDAPLSVSVGAATTDGGTALRLTLTRADQAMYQDKARRHPRLRGGGLEFLAGALLSSGSRTPDHLACVESLALRMAKALGLDPRATEELRQLAGLHDIGKAADGDEDFATCPGKTAPERAVVEQHVMLGYRLSTATPRLARLAHCVLHHHEWWDGTGYPGGLREDAIPLASRIVAVAEAYDRLISGRPGRPALSAEDALAALEAGAGTQFDPALVELLGHILGGRRTP